MKVREVLSAVGGATSRVLVSEDNVSLKLVFDNLRNFAICAGLFAAARWLNVQLEGYRWFSIPAFWFVWVIWLLAFGLSLLNAAQSYVIAARFFDKLEAFINRLKVDDGLRRLILALATVFAVASGLFFVATIALLLGWVVFGPASMTRV